MKARARARSTMKKEGNGGNEEAEECGRRIENEGNEERVEEGERDQPAREEEREECRKSTERG